jgi:hypothetical protein
MSEKLKTTLLYGLYAAIISVLLSVVLYVTDFILLSLYAGIFVFLINTAILVFLLIFFGKKIRNAFSPESYKYGAAFKDMLIIIGVITIIAVAYNAAFLLWIEPGYEERVMVEVANKVEIMMYNQGLPQSQIDNTINEMLNQPKKSVAESSLGALVYSVVFGVIISLICAAFVKKKPVDAFDEAMGGIN